jgi:hypothetical protein
MNLDNPTRSKLTWMRLATIIGITCVVISWAGYISCVIVWHINGSNGRFYSHVVGPAMLLAFLISIICGIFLRRRKIGIILIVLGIIFFILQLLTPEL